MQSEDQYRGPDGGLDPQVHGHGSYPTEQPARSQPLGLESAADADHPALDALVQPDLEQQLNLAQEGADEARFQDLPSDAAQSLNLDGTDLGALDGLEGPQAALPTQGELADPHHLQDTAFRAQALSPRHQLESWLDAMIKSEASDLILRAGGRPSCRIHGKISFLPGTVPHAGALLEVLEGICGKDRMSSWRDEGSVDSAVQLDGLGRFRLNAYKQMGEPAIVLRRISDSPPQLENLCLPTRDLQSLAMRKRGIILVTGIAGSGKSTTLGGMIEHMNHVTERHVITLEDPIEMIFTEDRCVISQREIGTDVPNFAGGLKHSLRQSPDVILIGEMRDAETVRAALDATETGHLVMSTCHTVNAAQTVDRIVSFFPPEQHSQIRQRLADNLVAVLSQRLVSRRDDQGLVPAVELMVSTPHMRELVVEGRTNELSVSMDSGLESGMISFNQSLRKLMAAGLIDMETAVSASDRPDELRLAMRGYRGGGNGAGPNEAGGEGSSLRLSH